MDASKHDQVEALLSGDPYKWAVQNGYVRAGEPLRTTDVFTVRRTDVVEYLRTHPVPGIDVRQAAYRGLTDGPKFIPQDSGFAIGWQERGIFTPEFIAADEAAAREFWINFLADSRGLAA
jgi:hypothetical protein